MLRSRYEAGLGPAVVVAGLGIAGLAGLFVAGPDAAQGQQGPTSFAGPPSFADVVEQVNPAVVTVAVTKEAVAVRTSSGASPWSGTPFEDFFGRFGVPEQLPVPQPRQGEGSGFVIDPEGYIATNNHVVAGASALTVTFADGKQLAAEIVGTDPRTDLALIRVDSPERLPALRLGDSDDMRVGDWVLAIGNPFGLGGTATAGIVSARGRDIQAGYYDDFLQIDAAINSGNSGGPVFNAAGQVIGINTAIFSPTGGNVGIGFAIPSNQARDVLEDLRNEGVVSRGWLGISMVPDRETEAGGVVIDTVDPAGPAAAAGLLAGDIVTRFGDEPVDSTRELARLVGSLDAGDAVAIRIVRDGAELEVEAELDRLDEARLQARAQMPSPGQWPQSGSGGAERFFRR